VSKKLDSRDALSKSDDITISGGSLVVVQCETEENVENCVNIIYVLVISILLQ